MYFTIAYRTVFLYILIVIYYRIMGKKEVGELGIIDLIVSFSIAELASICIEEPDKSIFTSILPITLLVILEITLSYIGMKSDKFRKMTDGSPSVIIDKGKINLKVMSKLRYTLDDLLTQIREKDVKNLEEVKYAVLETDGELSVFTDNYDYPLPLIVDGVVDTETLKNIKKNDIWLNEMLKKNNVELENVYYAFYRNNSTFIIKKDELL
ncbi:MAG: DUF421 domain-containing protein [Bacilli bacterium]|nr:DUF421 domain-containing protein [Bacilli bacterium]